MGMTKIRNDGHQRLTSCDHQNATFAAVAVKYGWNASERHSMYVSPLKPIG